MTRATFSIYVFLLRCHHRMYIIVEIPLNVQRCCTRCYEKLIVQVRQRQTTNQTMKEEEDDDDDESSKIPSTIINDQNLKQDDGKELKQAQLLSKEGRRCFYSYFLSI
jgi:hypothetical protein